MGVPLVNQLATKREVSDAARTAHGFDLGFGFGLGFVVRFAVFALSQQVKSALVNSVLRLNINATPPNKGFCPGFSGVLAGSAP